MNNFKAPFWLTPRGYFVSMNNKLKKFVQYPVKEKHMSKKNHGGQTKKIV